MSWKEISFTIASTEVPTCIAHLESHGAQAVSLFDSTGQIPILEPTPGSTPLWEEVKVVGLFSVHDKIEPLLTSLESALPHIHIHHSLLADRQWETVWQEHFKPLCFGNRLWISPVEQVHHIHQPNAVIVKLDPGLAFGTGSHPTTALCLEWLDKHPLLEQTVIDYGCGSGILGIAAALLGAKHVWAIDHDPQALLSTQANSAKNQIAPDQLQALLPSEFSPTLQVHTVLANILASPLIELAPLLSGCCQPQGSIVLSGLLFEQVTAVQKAYAPWFTFERPYQKEEWALLSGTKNP